MSVPLEAVGWMPVEFQTGIRWCNLIGSGVGVIALVMLMAVEWKRMTGVGQHMRYLVLLGYALLISGGTAERMADTSPYVFGYRTVATLALTLFLLVAIAVTWRDAYKDRKKTRV